MIQLELWTREGWRVLEFAQDEVSLGRGAENTLPISDEKASRHHATIFKSGNEFRLRDESRNGMLLNGKRLEGEPVLVAGDEVKIGDTPVRVKCVDGPAPAAAPPLPPVRTARDQVLAAQRLRSRITGAVVGAVSVVAIYITVNSVMKLVDQADRSAPPAPAAAAPEDSADEARAALERLRARSEAAPIVSDALIEDVREAASLYGPSAPGETPFEDLLGRLMQRRARESARRLADARGRVDGALRQGAYATATHVVKTLQSNPDPLFRSATGELVARVQEAIGKDFRTVDAFGKRLEDRKLYLDAVAHYASHAPRFKGTVHYKYLENKPDLLEKLCAAEALARAPKPAPTRVEEPESATPKADPAPSKPEAPADPLLPKLVAAINKGRIPGNNYATPTHYRAAGKEHAWSEVGAADMLKLYEALEFKGEDLRQLAEWAWTRELKEDAAKLLSRYLRGGRRERRKTVDGMIAAWRGVPVPEGGYAWHSKFGWEDGFDRLNREAAARVPGLCRKLSATSDARTVTQLYQALVRYHDAEGMKPELVHSIRVQSVAALRANKDRRLKAIESKAKRSVGFAQLKALKVELNKRRAAALKVIYDQKIYLREDHPDWRKGEEFNGQAEVDKLVLEKHAGTVEELWKRAGSIAASLDKSIQREVELLNRINGEYLPGLGEKPGADELKAYEQVMLNLNARVNLKSIALNAEEADITSWNRRVEKYNEALQDPRVSSDDKAHAKVVNDYREMMGRKRLFIDPRLCVATKKHSAAQNEAQRIWHVGPDGDPQSRARAEGFPAGVGENVAIGYGSPDDIWWRGWYRASDHHRNALSKGWTCMGYGYAGNVGTENFSNLPAPSGFPAR